MLTAWIARRELFYVISSSDGDVHPSRSFLMTLAAIDSYPQKLIRQVFLKKIQRPIMTIDIFIQLILGKSAIKGHIYSNEASEHPCFTI